MSTTEMSQYERRAYERLTERPSSGFRLLPDGARQWAGRRTEQAKDLARKLPGTDAVESGYGKALQGVNKATTGLGLQSVSVEAAVRKYQKSRPDIRTAEDVRALDLEVCDLALPRKRILHSAIAAGEGAAASLAITGATVSTTVSGGTTAAIAVGAVAADSAAVLTGLGRVVGEIACSYGYDPRSPEEELFALQVIGLSLAAGDGAKAAALASLSRLTQDMMRRATWTQLENHVLVKVIQSAFGQLGLKLTQKKLGQVVPFAGVAISAGMNLKLVHDTYEAAQSAYRLRFLQEKYRLNVGSELVLVQEPMIERADDPGSLVRVDQLLDEAVENEGEAGDEEGDGTESR